MMKIKHFTTAILTLLFSLAIQSQTSKTANPEKDFDTFWNTFRDHYAFFKLKKVDWDATYKKYRPQVKNNTSENDLTATFAQMVEPLHDGHITISKGDDILYKGKKASYFKQEFKGIEKELWATSFATLAHNGFSPVQFIGPLFKDEPLYSVAKSNQVGYIRISRCFANPESLFDDAKEADDLKLQLSLFDSILNSLSATKALIIDMRSNGGGHGGFELASRFASEKRLTHYKSEKKKGGYEKFTKQKAIYLIPNKGVRHLHPIVILTNDKTASSAEDFTVSLYRQSNVSVIGMNTSGMFSDMFGAELSDGISFTLSNQRYYSTDNNLLEDVGVPVNVEVRNTKMDIENHSDPVILKALELLDN